MSIIEAARAKGVSKDMQDAVDNIKQSIEYKTEKISLDLALIIHNRLEELQINQLEFAKKLKVSKSYVLQVLNGNSNMTIKSLIKIADVIDLNPIIAMEKITKKSINN